jgi:hypothetical protein
MLVSCPRLPCGGESRPLRGCVLLIFPWRRGKTRQLTLALSGQCSRFKMGDLCGSSATRGQYISCNCRYIVDGIINPLIIQPRNGNNIADQICLFVKTFWNSIVKPDFTNWKVKFFVLFLTIYHQTYFFVIYTQ